MSGFRNIKIPVQIGRWSSWYDLQSYVGKNKYTISFENVDSFQDAPFEVQIKHLTPGGPKIVPAIGPGEYTIEGDGVGTDQIRVKSIAAIFGTVTVTVPN